MNGREIAAVLAAIVVMAGAAQPAMAQSPLDGPLSSPGATPAPKTHAKAKPRKAHHANAKPAATSDAAPRATPADAPVASHTAPADPLDLGMKWQGSSDGSAQTKFQSGPNTSSGSGAEVGMKLHF